MWQEFRSDTYAGVSYFDLDLRILSVDFDLDLTSAGGEFHRVAKQVPEYLLHATGISQHHKIRSRLRGFDFDSFRFCGRM